MIGSVPIALQSRNSAPNAGPSITPNTQIDDDSVPLQVATECAKRNDFRGFRGSGKQFSIPDLPSGPSQPALKFIDHAIDYEGTEASHPRSDRQFDTQNRGHSLPCK